MADITPDGSSYCLDSKYGSSVAASTLVEQNPMACGVFPHNHCRVQLSPSRITCEACKFVNDMSRTSCQVCNQVFSGSTKYIAAAGRPTVGDTVR